VVLSPTRPVASLTGTDRGTADRAQLVAARVESLLAARHDHAVRVQPITAAGTGRHSPMLKVNPPSGQDGKYFPTPALGDIPGPAIISAGITSRS